MRRAMGILTLICTIVISTVLNGSAEMIINMSSIVIVLGTYSAGILLTNIKLDDILGEVGKQEKNENIIGKVREMTKMASVSAMILSIAINGLNLIYNYTDFRSVGEPIQGILVTLLYVAFIQFIIDVVLCNQVKIEK